MVWNGTNLDLGKAQHYKKKKLKERMECRGSGEREVMLNDSRPGCDAIRHTTKFTFTQGNAVTAVTVY